MISYADAIQTVRATVATRTVSTQTVALQDAVLRICAQDIFAPLDIQPFDNSAMDGFAVRLEDLAHATQDRSVTLKKIGTVAAGQAAVKTMHLQAGTCFHVMTGAPLPVNAQAVVPVENTAIEGDNISFRAAPAKADNIRRAGEDFKKGAPVLRKGEHITPAHILPLATLGIATLDVFKRPRVLYVSTGAEIVDDLSTLLQDAMIYNSNKYYAAAFLSACGAEVHTTPIVRDDVRAFEKIIRAAEDEEYDLVVSSGAVSAGSFDFVKDGLEKAGARIVYHKIALKPGKPNLLATLSSGTPYFGLPGNPVATAAGLRFFVGEALCAMLQKNQYGAAFSARIAHDFSKKRGLHMILKGRLSYATDGTTTAHILDGQESFKVSPFLHMNCWIHVPEEREKISAGDIVDVAALMP